MSTLWLRVTGFVTAAFAGMQAKLVMAAPEGVDVPGGDALGAHSREAGGLPQLDPSSYSSQIFWLAVTFVLLYLIFSRKILPELSSTIESRHARIQEDLESAESLKEEAESIHQAYEGSLKDARDKASDMFVKAEASIKSKAEKANAKMNETIIEKVTAMEAEIVQAKNAAMADMNTIAAEVSAEAAAKIIGVSADVKQAETVVQKIGKKAA